MRVVINKNERRISLLVEGYPRLGFQLYSRLLKTGVDGVCVSRMHPEYVMQKYDLPEARCFWLSSCKGKDVMQPKVLSQISKSLRGAIKQGKQTAVFLDGLEYLLLYNDLNKVMGFLRDMEASLLKQNAEMLVSIDPLTFEQRDLDQLFSVFPRLKAEELDAMLPSSQPQQSVAAAPLSVGQTV
jgi:hypothetical protein